MTTPQEDAVATAATLIVETIKEQLDDGPAMTLEEWCTHERISKSSLYGWPKEDWPEFDRNGKKLIIRPGARRKWRRQRDAKVWRLQAAE
jgi:hypothetical protein